MAVQRRLPDEGLLAHSDRGSQYASEHYQRLLAKHGIACRMSRRPEFSNNWQLRRRCQVLQQKNLTITHSPCDNSNHEEQPEENRS
jgi:hypothetical protein